MNAQPEQTLQRAIVNYLRAQYPQVIVHHSPNGESREKRQDRSGKWFSPAGARLKAMGTLAGWPDLMLLWEGRLVFIELKSPHGTLNSAQRELRAKLDSAGFEYYVFNDFDSALSTLQMILGKRP